MTEQTHWQSVTIMTTDFRVSLDLGDDQTNPLAICKGCSGGFGLGKFPTDNDRRVGIFDPTRYDIAPTRQHPGSIHEHSGR